MMVHYHKNLVGTGDIILSERIPCYLRYKFIAKVNLIAGDLYMTACCKYGGNNITSPSLTSGMKTGSKWDLSLEFNQPGNSCVRHTIGSGLIKCV